MRPKKMTLKQPAVLRTTPVTKGKLQSRQMSEIDKAVKRYKNRPRAQVLANRKVKVLAAVNKMKAEPGKHYSWATQDRLVKEARNRGWTK